MIRITEHGVCSYFTKRCLQSMASKCSALFLKYTFLIPLIQICSKLLLEIKQIFLNLTYLSKLLSVTLSLVSQLIRSCVTFCYIILHLHYLLPHV